MRTRIVRKATIDLSAARARQLSSLTFRETGLMAGALSWSRQKQWNGTEAAYVRNTWCYILEDVDTRTVLAWALVIQDRKIRGEPPTAAYFYTRASCRNQGYAKRLYNQILKYEKGRIMIFPHDRASLGMANSFKKMSRRTKTY